jgi:hypothetical protein
MKVRSNAQRLAARIAGRLLLALLLFAPLSLLSPFSGIADARTLVLDCTFGTPGKEWRTPDRRTFIVNLDRGPEYYQGAYRVRITQSRISFYASGTNGNYELFEMDRFTGALTGDFLREPLRGQCTKASQQF